MQNRKTATKLLLVQWSRFQNVCMKLEGSTLVTGVNGSGKSTVLDAMTYLLTGNTQFNKAAKDRDRTVKAYVRGDTKSNGEKRYLRSGQVVSYIAMEFQSPVEEETIVTGVCIESLDDVATPASKWFIVRDAKIEDINFAQVKEKKLLVTPRKELTVKGEPLKRSEFMSRERGTEQVLRALGLRCDVNKYRSKLLKMMAFNPENNIDQFISECVLEPGNINSLNELREQREQFDRIKKIYEDLKAGKEQLEKIQDKIKDYETKKRNLDIKQMMLSYQDLLQTEKEEERIEERLSALEQKRTDLEKKQSEMLEQFDQARKRLQAAETNDIYQGMQNSIKALQDEIRTFDFNIKKSKEETEKLEELQNRFTEDLSWCFEENEELNDGALFGLAEPGYQVEQKRNLLSSFFKFAEKKREQLASNRVHNEDEKRELKEKIAKLDEKIKRLEANQLSFPDEIVRAKELLNKEFLKQGIHTEVKIFAELVHEVKDLSWRRAIETFLGRKRYHIIVDGKYCHKAIEILQEKKLYDATVVITDKLPESEIKNGSAASQLEIANVYARRYANYLLNQIHLCNSIEELHECPKGGLMKNGMLAKSYAVSYMKTKKTEICFGLDAIQLQKEEAKAQQSEMKDQLKECMAKWDAMKIMIDSLRKVDFNINHYRLDAPDILKQNMLNKKQREEEIEQLENNPDFLAVIKEQQNAKQAFDDINMKKENTSNDIAVCKARYSDEQKSQRLIKEQILNKKKSYEELCLQHLDLEQDMLEEYEKLKGKKGTILVLNERSVKNASMDIENCIKELDDLQIEYCRISEIDFSKHGIAYIPYYRMEYRNIANVKIEEAHSRLEKQSKKLESAFMNDFVAEMNEMIAEAKREIYAINKELKEIPFGQDTYKFTMVEKPDRMIFFRICKKLENYMNSPEFYMNSGKEDEEMERDIQEFMSMILEEEDESEFTDYRKYFTYDMEISSHQGKERIIAELSKKQGSASNGEKQTPYFIILAASLLQCYPKNSCCARLAFIDEAFSALSRERIEQMVKYLEENSFQVIYAAPPEKIGSIGQYVRSTASLVITGRYTDAVEGLVTFNEIYS